MPEGHTLFALARDLHEAFAGTSPEISSPQGKFTEGAALLTGRELVRATSRGKHLFAEFAGDRWLHVHLGLIGSFTVDSHEWTAEVPVVGQVRLRLRTEEHVADLRGPNLCQVVTPEQVDAVLTRLGPDPLRADADPALAWDRISRSSRTIAELLMDQAVVAGVGNVYRCEILYRHRLSPFTEGRTLRRRSWEAGATSCACFRSAWRRGGSSRWRTRCSRSRRRSAAARSPTCQNAPPTSTSEPGCRAASAARGSAPAWSAAATSSGADGANAAAERSGRADVTAYTLRQRVCPERTRNTVTRPPRSPRVGRAALRR
jgi:endonuclease-8